MKAPEPDSPRRRADRRLGTALLLSYGIATLLLVFSPISWQLNRLTVRLWVALTNRVPGQGLLPEDVGTILNVVLFVPVGFALGLLTTSPRRALAIAIGASALIEIIQLIPTLGRQASLSDVLTNAAGAAVGVGLAWVWHRR